MPNGPDPKKPPPPPAGPKPAPDDGGDKPPQIHTRRVGGVMGATIGRCLHLH